jgi:SET domain-containing protein
LSAAHALLWSGGCSTLSGSAEPHEAKTATAADRMRFINHSEAPNIQGTNEPDGGHDVALRDIEAGEKLTVVYREFEDVPLMARIEGDGPRPAVP